MSKAKTKKAEPKLKRIDPVVTFNIPVRYSYGDTPVTMATTADAEEVIAKGKVTHKLEACVIGDYLAVQNYECDETFIIHKDVVKELAEAVA